MINKPKIQTPQRVISGRIIAGIVLASLVALLFHANSQTDIGSAFAAFYLQVLIVIFIIVWLIFEIRRHLKK